jgi:LPPG:FO 2-phospho-L-lactate transferase
MRVGAPAAEPDSADPQRADPQRAEPRRAERHTDGAGKRIVVLAGGIGGARFLLGVRAVARQGGHEVTAVVNVGDDVTLHGLRICPDLDSVMYTLGGGADPERGWGRANETWTVKEELAAYGAEPTWFGLGDRDVATHLVRTRMLGAGYPLSAVTEALCARWQPGIRLLPATDDRVETHVVVDRDGGGEEALHFQEWWVRYRGERAARRFVFVGAESATPAPGVLEALAAADVVLLAPSNPVVSIAPILAVAKIRDALGSNRAPVVGVSPIIGGAPVRGMADKCLAAIGVECSAAGVGGLYGARGRGGVLDGWLVDPVDAATAVEGVTVRAVPLWMTDEQATAAIVRAALDVAGV